MNTVYIVWIIHVLAGLVVVVEALNKLERCDVLAPGLDSSGRLVELLKVIAWMLLALGAGGAIAGPVLMASGVHSGWLPLLLRLEVPTLDHMAVMVGTAVMVVRSRVKEEVRRGHASDA